MTSMDNPFTPPDDGFDFTVGKPTRIEWTPTTEGRVTLWLRHANGGAQWVIAIAENIKNTGSYTWTPTPDLEPPSGLDADTYTLLIGPDSDDPDSSTNQVLITIKGSNNASTASSGKSTSTAGSTSEAQTITLTVSGPGGSASTAVETVSRPSPTNSLPPPSTSTDPPTDGNPGVKVGAGVGIGVGLPVVLIILLGAFIWRRRRASRRSEMPLSEGNKARNSSIHELPHEGHSMPHELAASERVEAGGRPLSELPASTVRAELEGDKAKAQEG